MNIINFPNVLTLIRISLIPILIIVFYLPWECSKALAACIFLIAASTDWLDGYLARKLKQETKFGAFCDPVADKLIVVVALLLLSEVYASYLVTIPAIIIAGREIVISGLREWMAHNGQSNSVSVVYIGKVKTVIQMVAITVMLYSASLDNVIFKNFGISLLFVAAALTIWSMLVYLSKAWSKLSGKQ